MLAVRLFLALGLVALALPAVAPTASAYCCPPICLVCIIVAQEVHSLSCTETTTGASTTIDCSSWLTGDHGQTVDAPVPVVARLCFHETGAPNAATCTV